MRGSIIGIGIGLGLLGCAPDLTANGAQRCVESLECQSDAVCYRGFCVPSEGVHSDSGSEPVEVVDAASQPSPTQSEHDAGITPTNEAVSDAASAATGVSQAVDASAPQSGPSASDPAVMQPKPQPGMPAQPAQDAGTQDAGSQDAGTVVVDLPGSCTLADCCEEARNSLNGQDDDDSNQGPGASAGPKAGAGPMAGADDKSEPKEKKAKSCGCADPALLSGILCGLLGPLGVVP